MAQAQALPKRSRAFSALRHRDYRKYFVTTVLGMTGENIEHVITYWVIFQEFHSPALGGFAVISHWVPFLLFSFHAGALADRFDCRKLIQFSEGLFMLVSLAWGLLFLTGTLQVWHVVVLLTLHGMAGVVFEPASQVIIYEIVGREHLTSAVRLNATSRQLAILVGPAIGGTLMWSIGSGRGLLTNVAIYLPMVLLMRFFSYSGRRADATRRGGLGLREAIGTFRGVSADRRILITILLAGAASLLVGNGFVPQMPEYAQDLGAGEGDLWYSALLAANAAGAVAGALLLETSGLLRPSVRTAIVCAGLWSLAMGLFAAASQYWVAIALLIVAGFLHISYLSIAQTLIQLHAPHEIRGRVIGFFNAAGLGLRTGSGFTIGVLGSAVGIHWSLAISTGALLLVAIGFFVYVTAAERRT